MNAFSFIGLMRSIYGKTLPDLEKIQSKGLLAVKIAQHFALRIDFLDEHVCRHLSQLYRKTTPVAPGNVEALLDAAVDGSWRRAFDYFDTTALASASIGQVHAARLTGGEEVIVKVLRKDFRESFLSDLRSLRRLLHFALFFSPKLRRVADPEGILDHIRDYTISELDLRNELEGQRLLKSIYTDYRDQYDLSHLRFHKIYPELTSKSVLVAERVRGRTFDELLERGELPYEQLLALFNIHGFYLFGPGIFHGDIHPGNVFLDEKGMICLIDTGAVSSIGTKMKNGLFQFFVQLSQYDYNGCVDALHAMAENKIDEEKLERFRRGFMELYRGFSEATVSQVSLTKKMMDTIKLAVNSGMRFERGMFAIIKGLMYMDGMVLRCNPDAVLMKDMGRFIGNLKPLIEGGPFATAMELPMTTGGFRA